LQTHRIEDISVVRWTGPVVDGDGAAQLGALVTQLVDDAPFVVLDLSGVDSIDSAGLGLLVRLRTTLHHAGGDLKLCAVPASVLRVLQVTRLGDIFDAHPGEADACAAFAAPPSRATGSADLGCDVLCCHASTDLLMYLRELLRGAGFRVAISANVADAVRLARARGPRVVLISADLRALFEERDWGRGAPVIVELASDFARQDPSEAARTLLERIGSCGK
jgi:anti-anti-sigma factor